LSGIVGIYYLDSRPVDPQDLDRMVASLAHRGPDGAGTWRGGCVGFGHRMLWTTPESLQEKLPRTDRTGDLVLTADARIDNRDELIAALGLANRVPGEISDSELILAAYERWGEASPAQLLGDFAFAIWDKRRQTLFCARDPAGVKPFYYFHHPGKAFIFASEIKALLCVPGVPRELNEVRVAYHLVGFFQDPSITFYREIYRLPAAHSLRVHPGESRLRTYWSLDPGRELRLRSDAEYAEAFRDLFTQTVRCRLRSAFPVGSNLSGGLDSSSIACTARDTLAAERNGRLQTFSAIFPSLSEEDRRVIDERACIEAVVAMGGLDPHYIHADQLSPLAELDRVLWHQDEALYAPNLYLHVALGDAASRQGVRVVLDGNDGDTTVCHGWRRLTELAWTGRWATFYTELTASARKWRGSRRTLFWHYCMHPLVVQPAARLWDSLRGQLPNLSSTAINPSLARRVALAERLHVLAPHPAAVALTTRREHWQALSSPLWPYALELADRTAAACSVEFRYPFFDRRLMEFCLSLPSAQKLSQGWTRVVLRRAMQGILPEKVQWRLRKASLAPNFRRKLLEYDRAVLESVILNEPERIAEFVDVPALQAAYHRYAADALQSDQDINIIYRAVILGRWLCRSELTCQALPPERCCEVRVDECSLDTRMKVY
jgi:asparagine synthase (glutamine-hydrolysing)